MTFFIVFSDDYVENVASQRFSFNNILKIYSTNHIKRIISPEKVIFTNVVAESFSLDILTRHLSLYRTFGKTRAEVLKFPKMSYKCQSA